MADRRDTDWSGLDHFSVWESFCPGRGTGGRRALPVQVHEPMLNEFGGRQVVGCAGLATIELRPAQPADVRQHAIAGNHAQQLREVVAFVGHVISETHGGKQGESEAEYEPGGCTLEIPNWYEETAPHQMDVEEAFCADQR